MIGLIVIVAGTLLLISGARRPAPVPVRSRDRKQ
jgi:hypothetical protein